MTKPIRLIEEKLRRTLVKLKHTRIGMEDENRKSARGRTLSKLTRERRHREEQHPAPRLTIVKD